jgi:hypothetical protein
MLGRKTISEAEEAGGTLGKRSSAAINRRALAPLTIRPTRYNSKMRLFIRGPTAVQLKKISRQAEELSLLTVFNTLDGHPGGNLIELVMG